MEIILSTMYISSAKDTIWIREIVNCFFWQARHEFYFKTQFKKKKKGFAQWHMPIIMALGRHRQVSPVGLYGQPASPTCQVSGRWESLTKECMWGRRLERWCNQYIVAQAWGSEYRPQHPCTSTAWRSECIPQHLCTRTAWGQVLIIPGLEKKVRGYRQIL